MTTDASNAKILHDNMVYQHFQGKKEHPDESMALASTSADEIGSTSRPSSTILPSNSHTVIPPSHVPLPKEALEVLDVSAQIHSVFQQPAGPTMEDAGILLSRGAVNIDSATVALSTHHEAPDTQSAEDISSLRSPAVENSEVIEAVSFRTEKPISTQMKNTASSWLSSVIEEATHPSQADHKPETIAEVSRYDLSANSPCISQPLVSTNEKFAQVDCGSTTATSLPKGVQVNESAKAPSVQSMHKPTQNGPLRSCSLSPLHPTPVFPVSLHSGVPVQPISSILEDSIPPISSPLGVPLQLMESDPNPLLPEDKRARNKEKDVPGIEGDYEVVPEMDHATKDGIAVTDEAKAIPAIVVSSHSSESTESTHILSIAVNRKENVPPKAGAEAVERSPLENLQVSTESTELPPNSSTATNRQRPRTRVRSPFKPPSLLKSQAGGDETKSLAFPDLRVETKMVARKSPVGRTKTAGTAAARAAFKSPLRVEGSQSKKLVLTSKKPRVQTVQQRLQVLERALKIKEDKEDEKLQELIEKWRDVAKTVAWELWEIVREGNVDTIEEDRHRPVGGRGFGGFANGGFDDEWCWGGEEKREKQEEHEGQKEMEEEVKEERSIGLMLRQLGIAHETLGWDEEEGDFVDVK